MDSEEAYLEQVSEGGMNRRAQADRWSSNRRQKAGKPCSRCQGASLTGGRHVTNLAQMALRLVSLAAGRGRGVGRPMISLREDEVFILGLTKGGHYEWTGKPTKLHPYPAQDQTCGNQGDIGGHIDCSRVGSNRISCLKSALLPPPQGTRHLEKYNTPAHDPSGDNSHMLRSLQRCSLATGPPATSHLSSSRVPYSRLGLSRTVHAAARARSQATPAARSHTFSFPFFLAILPLLPSTLATADTTEGH